MQPITCSMILSSIWLKNGCTGADCYELYCFYTGVDIQTYLKGLIGAEYNSDEGGNDSSGDEEE